MNVELIKRLIESNNETSPELTYSNPLLDKKVTRALSKSFLKILNISKDNSHKNLRLAVLENIRKMCKIEPDEHVKVDESLTELVVSYYEKQIESMNNPNNNDAIDKRLDAFLIRKSKEISINSSFQTTMNPEVTQALLNLDEKVTLKDNIAKDIIHWNQDDKRCLKLLKEIWNSDAPNNCRDVCDDASIKIKTEIEKLLLDISYNILHDDNKEIEELLAIDTYKNLINTCSVSMDCFQICTCILNTLFLMNNFHHKIQNLIFIFVQKVKSACTEVTFSILYPTHLTHLVTLLDINLDELPPSLRENYIQLTVTYLKTLHEQSQTDLILLLSHFPQWDDIYFEK